MSTCQSCGKSAVVSEKFCVSCIICQDQVSLRFKNFKHNLDLIPLVGITEKYFMSVKYGFVLEYAGEMYLKGVFDGFEEDDIHYKIRGIIQDERYIAIREGIIV